MRNEYQSIESLLYGGSKAVQEVNRDSVDSQGQIFKDCIEPNDSEIVRAVPSALKGSSSAYLMSAVNDQSRGANSKSNSKSVRF